MVGTCKHTITKVSKPHNELRVTQLIPGSRWFTCVVWECTVSMAKRIGAAHPVEHIPKFPGVLSFGALSLAVLFFASVCHGYLLAIFLVASLPTGRVVHLVYVVWLCRSLIWVGKSEKQKGLVRPHKDRLLQPAKCLCFPK